MFLFLLLWLTATAIIFSLEIVAIFYWYQINIKLLENYNQSVHTQLNNNYLNFSNVFILWFQIILCFLLGILLGWYSENKFKLLEKLNRNWQQKQPEFYKNTKGEYRVFLPWLIAELPLLIISIINICILLFFDSKNYISIMLLTLTLGTIVGQGIEISKRYINIIEMDRPEKPPTSFIEKINPNINSKNKLLMGQLYTKVVVPFFCIFLLLFTPKLFIIIKNFDDRTLGIILISLLIGITLRWQKDLSSSFYFNKITIFNVLFTSLKSIFLLLTIFTSITFNNNIYITIIISILCGFLLPWHPEKLRK